MARQGKLTDEEFIEYIKSYQDENPGKKIKYTDVEKYIQNHGIDIPDGCIKKKKILVEYIKKLNTDEHETHISRIYAYTPLDITELSVKTHLPKSVLEILQNRELAVKQIVESAIYISEENKRLTDINKTINSENKALKETIEVYKKKDTTLASKDKEIQYYKNMLEKICLPEVFEIIITGSKAGENISQTKLEENILTASKSISDFKNDIAEEFMEGFDE